MTHEQIMKFEKGEVINLRYPSYDYLVRVSFTDENNVYPSVIIYLDKDNWGYMTPHPFKIEDVKDYVVNFGSSDEVWNILSIFAKNMRNEIE